MPKIWKDMNREEKGELLLAYHEGKTIQVNLHGGNQWFIQRQMIFRDDHAYRVKPEPKVETITLFFGLLVEGALLRKSRTDTHTLQMTLVDGLPTEGVYVNEETGKTITINKICRPF